MLESLFNKVADRKVCNMVKKRLQHSCFLVSIEIIDWNDEISSFTKQLHNQLTKWFC